MNAGQDRRRSARRRIDTAAELRSRLQPYFPVSITDLSRTGFRMASWAVLDEARHTLVKLPSLAGTPVQLVWARDNEFGFRFERPLHPAVFDLLVARHAAPEPC
jgi:hypothetical protein